MHTHSTPIIAYVTIAQSLYLSNKIQQFMDDGQNLLALMMKKKRAEGSLDMPKKKKKKAKKQEPPPTPPPPTPEPEGQLIVTVEEPQDNQFFDEQAKQAQQNLDKQKKKVRKLNGLMARLHASVQQIKQRYNDIDIAELLSKKPNRQKIARARAFVKSQVVKKNQFQNRMDEVKSKESKRKNEKKVQQTKTVETEKQKQIAEMRKDFEEKKKGREKQIRQSMEKEEQAKKLLANYLGEKPLYVKMQTCQDKKDKKEVKQNQMFLKKRGEKFKPLDYKQIQIHQKAHADHLKDAALLKQQEQIQKHQQLMQQNLRLLQKIYRGKNYEMAQQEVEDRKMLRLRIKQQRQKMKQYASYVKQNYQPQLKEEDQQEDSLIVRSEGQPESEEDQDIDDQTRRRKEEDKFPRYIEVKRYKFLQGKSCGQMIQKMKAPYSERIQRRVGNGYLQHVKNLPKKRSQSKPQAVEVLTLLKTPRIEMPQIPRPKHYNVRISDTPNRVQLSNMLQLLKSKDSQRDMKEKYLTKLSGGKDKYQQHKAGQIHDDIISNIERKLSMLHQL